MKTSLEKAIELIKRSDNILLVPQKILTGDVLGSVLGLFFGLKNYKKKVDILLPSGIPEDFNFLPSPPYLTSPSYRSNLIIKVKETGKKLIIDELNYEKKESEVLIYLKTREGVVSKDQVELKNEIISPFQLLIVVGAGNFESLGEIFSACPEFFYQIPILNIDNKALNENFGQVNLVQSTSATVSEIISLLLKSLGGTEDIFDTMVANCLLAGIISGTKNFQNSQTRPQTFSEAASLTERGGDQKEIIRQLYKTKSSNQLKLLGRTLSRLKYWEQKQIAWVSIPLEDFQKTETSPKIIPSLLEDLREFCPHPILLTLWEERKENPSSTKGIQGIVSAPDTNLLEKFSQILEGEITQEFLTFSYPKTSDLKQATLEILTSLGKII